MTYGCRDKSRAILIVNTHDNGASFRAIGEQLGISHVAVFRLYHRWRACVNTNLWSEPRSKTYSKKIIKTKPSKTTHKTKILTILKQGDKLTSTEIAKMINLDKNNVKCALYLLFKFGSITRHKPDEKIDIKNGRPAYRYSLD